jgi:biopolymer transport protein ExbD
MRKLRRRHEDKTVELNITAFLNLMVILVPFLLITAVFSRLTVLELNLPALDAKTNKGQKIKLQLEMVVREESFDIQDARLGLIKRIKRGKNDVNWKAFTGIMVEIKRRFPEEQQIRLLLEKNIEYKTFIQVMDHVRSADIVQIGAVETIELFPKISIGDAPGFHRAQEIKQGKKKEVIKS